MASPPCDNNSELTISGNDTREKLTIEEEKYNLRRSSLVSRVQSERKRNSPKQPKPKSRPPPLSKYRRKTANHRERERMKDMNDAFEALRKAVPISEESDPKQTKVTTLKLAMDYIEALRKVLGYDCDSDSVSTSLDSECSDMSQCARSPSEHLNSDGESPCPSTCSISSGDDESSSNNDFDFTPPFDLGDDLCLDFDVDVALML